MLKAGTAENAEAAEIFQEFFQSKENSAGRIWLSTKN
jgi:hypothetical protein